MPEHSRNGCSQSCPLPGKPARCFAKIPVISICNALWSTHLYKHQSGSPEGVFVYRSSSLIVRLFAKSCGGAGIAIPRGNICCCCQYGFCSCPTAPAAVWVCVLSPCSPHILLLLGVRKGRIWDRQRVLCFSDPFWWNLFKSTGLPNRVNVFETCWIYLYMWSPLGPELPYLFSALREG